jgi:hypothetical protein
MIRRFAIWTGALALVVMLGTGALAKGGNGHNDPQPSTIALVQSNPRLGQWITFNTTYPGSTKNPRIIVSCYQPDFSGTLVWSQVGLVTDAYKLGGDSSPWLQNGGGPAWCEADLDSLIWNGNNMQQWTYLAGAQFYVSG